MAAHTFTTFALLLLLQAVRIFSTFTNLPDVPQGVFNVSTRIEIRSNKHAAWNALTDFPKYPEWNPFVRASIMISADNTTLRDQYPKENRRLFLRTQIPALPLPVNENTPDVEARTQYSYENVTAVQRKQGRLAWEFVPTTELERQIDLQSERWSAVSNIGRGKVLYESREVFHGSTAELLAAQIGGALQTSFEAQGQALKALLEDCDKD
ncbi:hypothetical protein N0V87_000085 [Didymella glomerata]|jgi:hypothetical protein|uniref:Coenzyme Q-binding protein COQ10 START domain-containing protein n=1 Tax=Didymella glomerata TaxID=749621 RepID=A0A9W8X8I2_9PLEO|nr:hypothetical protein N0V87_000085 [Didymella glomerata]